MTHDEKIVEAVAEALWQAESRRAADRARLTPWSEESEKTREGWRFLARAAITAFQAEAGLKVANCCNCGRIIDTREVTQGGDEFGCELSDGRWVCSPECWDAVVESPLPPAPKATP